MDTDIMNDPMQVDNQEEQEDSCTQSFFSEHKEVSELIRKYEQVECFDYTIQKTTHTILKIVR